MDQPHNVSSELSLHGAVRGTCTEHKQTKSEGVEISSYLSHQMESTVSNSIEIEPLSGRQVL